MNAVSEPGLHVITVMACTQLMKTELVNNIVGYHIHLDPCPILVLQPTESMAETWSKDRLATMCRDTEPLNHVITKKGRDSSSTILHKSFPGGHITIVGAASPTELASRPIRLVLSDEIDKYPNSAGAEGDPISLAEERAATFPSNYLFVRVCSPTIKHQSRIEKSYHESDMRLPFVKCQHCNEWQTLSWSDVRWDTDEDKVAHPETAAIVCQHCGSLWSESDRLHSLQEIQWRQTKPFRCCNIDHDVLKYHRENIYSDDDLWHYENNCYRAKCPLCGESKIPKIHAGFKVSKLFSPWEPLSKLVTKFIDASRDAETLKVFINTQLAETWEEQGEKMDDSDLLAQRVVYAAEIPDEVALLTAGVDTQNDRLEVQIIGWGKDEKAYVIDYQIFTGDPSESVIWQQLDEYLIRVRKKSNGFPMVIESTCVDSGGHHTQTVYEFCRQRSARRVFAIRGRADTKGKFSPVWPRKPTTKNKLRAPLYEVGTQSAKFIIMRRLQIKEESSPGKITFPSFLDVSYFEQLTAEKLITRREAGKIWKEWYNPPGKRNEALDTFVYAYAALNALLQLGVKLNDLYEKMTTQKNFSGHDMNNVKNTVDVSANEATVVQKNIERRQPEKQKNNWITPKKRWL